MNNIAWSSEVEDKFEQLQKNLDAMKKYSEESIDNLKQLIKMVQGDLTRPMRQKIMCLITMDTHSRDVVLKLIDEHVKKADEF